MARTASSKEEAPPPETRPTTGSDEYVDRAKPRTVARCPNCDAWAFYRDASALTVCGKCRTKFRPSDGKRATVGE